MKEAESRSRPCCLVRDRKLCGLKGRQSGRKGGERWIQQAGRYYLDARNGNAYATNEHTCQQEDDHKEARYAEGGYLPVVPIIC